jgi:hypothetical protein
VASDQQTVQENVFDQQIIQENVFDPGPPQKKTPNITPPKDWRVRISLATDAKYLYGADNPGILGPLKNTSGVIFPYTPSIQVNYTAKYDSHLPAHSNYQIHSYQGSTVEGLSVTGDFTAQSVVEANYMLAVIHFFRSATKMFYGKDDSYKGTPPPLLYLSGYGQYQFDNHPMVLTSFTYTLPPDVDYIDAYSSHDGSSPGISKSGVSLSPFVKQKQQMGAGTGTGAGTGAALMRLLSGAKKLNPGGTPVSNSFKNAGNMMSEVTRVPTKISISLSLMPMITRRAITNEFSLAKYATGELLRGSKNPKAGGGIW